MQLNEIKEHIKPLSPMEKVQLIQDVAEMLKPSSDDTLQQFEQAAAKSEPSNQGPLEAYTAARQLHDFMKHPNFFEQFDITFRGREKSFEITPYRAI